MYSERREIPADAGYPSVRVELEELLLDTLVATEDRSRPREALW